VTDRTPTLAVDLGGLVVSTPVMIASGCAGTGTELRGLLDVRRVGAVVTRTITVAPRQGAAPPRIVETASGIVWSTGLQNPGVDAFLGTELPAWSSGPPVVVSIGGGSLEEYVRLTGALQGRPGVAAIELHLSGPDEEMERPVLGAHADRVTEIVGAVARMSLIPVFAKLPGGVDVVPLAVAAARAGATCLTLTDSPPALAMNAVSGRMALGGPTGRLAGPAVKPLMLRSVADVARALPRMPLIASGGVRTSTDAVEALLAGAAAVQVGTATLLDPVAPVTIAQGVATELRRRALSSPSQLRGSAPQAPAPEGSRA
jgi:dihydroorotate dehydrogenase (NAD+) catalytic subunit